MTGNPDRAGRRPNRADAAIAGRASDRAVARGVRTPALTAGLLLALLIALAASLRPAARPATPLLGAHLVRTNPQNLIRVHDLGFSAILQLMDWQLVEPDPGRFEWEYPDQVVAGAEAHGLQIVLRLDHPPLWATGREGNGPPRDPADYGRYVEAVARRYRGRVAAYVIWNEPNLINEWGGRPPDPAGYLALLREGFAGVRRGDPAALVVSAGLSPTNGDGDRAIDDRSYLRILYRLGARGYFDVLGAHPYAFGRPPADPNLAGDGLDFERIRDLRAILIENGDDDKPIWATEYGYTTRTNDPGSRWQVVSEQQQAQYLVETYDLVRRDMPWLTALFLWNVSADLPEYNDMQGYSIVHADGRPKPAYLALRQLQRQAPRLFGWDPLADRPPSVWPTAAGRSGASG